MHVLIIPSEQFLPPHNKLDGIFQYHQAKVLRDGGHRVGVLSVSLKYSLPMLAKAAAFRMIGKKTGNATDDLRVGQLLATSFTKAVQPGKLVSKESIDGLTVYRIDGLYYRPPVENENHLSWLKAGLICFEEYLKREGRPDIIHAHNAVYAGMLAQKIFEAEGIRYIITEHSSIYALGSVKKNTLTLAKQAYDKASGLFAVSKAFADYLNRLHSFNRFRYLPNVLDEQLENYPFHLKQKTASKFVFLHIASFIDVKDQATLLHAYKSVSDRVENTELWIGGGGELEEDLKEKVKRLGLQNTVKFLGLLGREEVIRNIQACDCFVLSSKYETFGVVVIESLLVGKPVIVTRCGVGQDIVDEKIGHVVEVGDAAGMASAMLKMIEEHPRYDAAYLRQFTISQFGKTAFAKQLSDIYQDVLQHTEIKSIQPNKAAAV